MDKYSEEMKQARKEVNLCLEIWKSLLIENFSTIIDYMYCKGSATKEWDSYIDYVPMLSDVDIHVKVKEDANFFDDESSFHESVRLPELYEERYVEKNPDYLHIPRIQIMTVNRLTQLIDFVYPRKDDIISLFGQPTVFENREPLIIRELDLRKALLLEEFLPTISLSMIDRTGLELWTMIRRMSWRVSPSPVRLISQTHEDPLSLWRLNRTKIVEELDKLQYYKIAENYKNYYDTGWIAFKEEFRNSYTLRKLISLGFSVLKLCLEKAKELQ